MRKLLLFSGSLLVSMLSIAQPYYQVTVSSDTYTELTGDIELTYLPGEGGYYYDDNFALPVFGTHTADFNQKTTPVISNGGFLSDQGYLAVYDAPGYQNTIVFQGLFHAQFSQVTGTTKVSAKMEGTTGDRILKFQVKDMVYDNDINQTVNLQIWLHEQDSSISYHYGPSGVSGTLSLCRAGIIIIDPSFTGLEEAFHLTGNPASPVATDTASLLAFMPGLDAMPANGTVYTFRRQGAPTGAGEIPGRTVTWKVYPNPAGDHLDIFSDARREFTIHNTAGQVVMIHNAQAPGLERIGISELPGGVYFIRTGGDSEVLIVR